MAKNAAQPRNKSTILHSVVIVVIIAASAIKPIFRASPRRSERPKVRSLLVLFLIPNPVSRWNFLYQTIIYFDAVKSVMFGNSRFRVVGGRKFPRRGSLFRARLLANTTSDPVKISENRKNVPPSLRSFLNPRSRMNAQFARAQAVLLSSTQRRMRM